MAESFGISQVTDYLKQMGLRIAQVDREHELLELSFHELQGHWRLIIAFQQQGEVRKILLIAPNLGKVTDQERLVCLEALMAVNYRIALGKFGLDLEDGEIRLEEAIPIAQDQLSLAQFRLAFGALFQTIAMYQSLIPRIVYGHLSANEAIEACERDFFLKNKQSFDPFADEDMNVSDILAEVTRLLEEKHD